MTTSYWDSSENRIKIKNIEYRILGNLMVWDEGSSQFIPGDFTLEPVSGIVPDSQLVAGSLIDLEGDYFEVTGGPEYQFTNGTVTVSPSLS